MNRFWPYFNVVKIVENGYPDSVSVVKLAFHLEPENSKRATLEISIKAFIFVSTAVFDFLLVPNGSGLIQLLLHFDGIV